ncbi:MAG: TIGR03087 family PEP-CTERM/XrtA system glycosyltransferase, partial [Pseudomonadales bacterium]|nr:TIGR03087 family PEP-CTERM/XrtA system glycosyltransferase [Pseudomonadales bacterium]
ELHPLKAKVLSLRAFFMGTPITLPYYASKELSSWVQSIVSTHDIQQSVVFSSSMAQYVEKNTFNHMNRVIDLVDVDSDKWRQYSEKTTFPMSWVYSREHKKLALYEKKIAAIADSVTLVSPQEADFFKTLTPENQQKIVAVSNGVDSDFFNVNASFPIIELPTLTVSFTGAMDYWANVEAVVWFCNKVWPSVLKLHPEACFYIVGTSPNADVLALHDGKHVVVTGRVKDVRPYIHGSTVVVAPLRIARGVQNKVLEALSMEKVVVGTSMAFEGIDYKNKEFDHEIDVIISDDKDQFISCLIAQLNEAQQNQAARQDNGGVNLRPINRAFVIQYYNWEAKLNDLGRLLHNSSSINEHPECSEECNL